MTHLMTAAEPIPVGELWPAVAEPILRLRPSRPRCLCAPMRRRSAWVRRWRVHQRRSDRFERMISVEEARALQAARRFQEADEILERLGPAQQAGRMAIAALAAALELRPRAGPTSSRAWMPSPGAAELAVRHLAEVEMLRARAALARGNEDEAARPGTAGRHRAPGPVRSFYRENQAALAETISNRALRTVLRRMPHLARRLSDAIANHPPADAPAAAGLSRQERRVLTLLAEGLPNKAIARRLGLATPTVKFHLTRLYAKLGARNRREAVANALSLGLIPA